VVNMLVLREFVKSFLGTMEKERFFILN